MRRFRSAFISAYAGIASAATVYALVRALSGGIQIGWFGAAISAGGVPAFAAIFMVSKPAARTSPNLPIIGWTAATGVAVACAGLGGSGIAPVLIALTGLAGYFVYTRWYSRFGRTPSPALEIDAALPDFTLTRVDGTDVSSQSFRGEPTVFVFYRGNWCPLCVAQVKELAQSYRDLAALGAQVVLVSPQPATATQALADRFDAPMQFLTDPDNRAAAFLGIVDRFGTPSGLELLGYDSDTVLPTVVIVDATGTIVFCDQTDNYRVRPEPATYLEVLASINRATD